MAGGGVVLASQAHAGGKRPSSSTNKGEADVGAAHGHGTLVLYAAEGYDAAIAAAFQKDTGIRVELTDNSTGPLIAQAEAQANNPHWDVIWFDGDSSAQAMDNQGLLLRNWTPNDITNYTPLGKSLLAPDHAYFPTGVTGMGAIGYNPHVVPANEVPRTLNDLLKPQWRGAIAMNDPAISGPAYPLIAGIVQQEGGLQQGERFLEALKQNGLHVYATNSVTIASVLSGREKLALVQDSALINQRESGKPLAIDYLQSGTFTLPSVIAIDAKAPDMAAAKKFVEWVLTPQAQAIMRNPKNGGGDSYFEPVIRGVQPDPAAVRPGVHWVKVNPIVAANEKNSLEEWFHDHITL
nr:extracellular solute-binding protein [Alicyclobacillus mali (ex Roth et al. 2021)]